MKKFLTIPLILLTMFIPVYSPTGVKHAKAAVRTGITLPLNNVGLVGHWTFDGKDMRNGRVDDISGQANHGSAIGMSTSTMYIPGKIGQGLNFDGVDDYVNVGAGSSMTLTTWTASAWIKETGIPAGGVYDAIFGGSYNATYAQLYLKDVSGWKFGVYANADFLGTTAVPTNEWVHVVAVIDAGANTLKTYVNSVLDRNSSNSFSFGANGGSVVMGVNGVNLNTEFFNGFIDDVRVYSRALSAKEIQQLYKLGATTKVAVTPRTRISPIPLSPGVSSATGPLTAKMCKAAPSGTVLAKATTARPSVFLPPPSLPPAKSAKRLILMG